MGSPAGENEDFNISASLELTVAELAGLIWQACGEDPDELTFEHLPSFEVDVQRRWPSVDKARELLGWEAQVDLRQGLAETVDWLRARGGRRGGAVSPVHNQAAVGFDRAGDDYERGRPGYPAPAVATLVRELELGPDRTVVDLAAGTGKLTRALLAIGGAGDRRRAGGRDAGATGSTTPQAEALDGTAEQIPLADSSADAVTVAQAFHWFDARAAAREIHRVLRPHGGLAVIWNSWDEAVPWVGAMQDDRSRARRRRAAAGEQHLAARAAGDRPVHGSAGADVRQPRARGSRRRAGPSGLHQLHRRAGAGSAPARSWSACAPWSPPSRQPALATRSRCRTPPTWSGAAPASARLAADAEAAAARLELGEHLPRVDALLRRQHPAGRDRPAGQQPHRRRGGCGRGHDRAADPEVRIGPRPHRDRAAAGGRGR